MMNKVVSAVVASIVLAGPIMAQDTAPAADPATDPAAMPDATMTTPAAEPDATMTAPVAEPDATMTTPAAEPDAMAGTAVVAPEGYILTDLGTVTAEQLQGVTIYDAEDASVAEIADLEIGADNMVTGVITDVGGFLGMGEHRILLSADQISVYKNADDDMRAYVSMTKDQLKELPAYEAPNQ